MISYDKIFDSPPSVHNAYCTFGSGHYTQSLDVDWNGYHVEGKGFYTQPSSGIGVSKPYFFEYKNGVKDSKFSFCSTNSGELSYSLSKNSQTIVLYKRGVENYQISFSGENACLFNLGTYEYGQDVVLCFYLGENAIKYRSQASNFSQEFVMMSGVSGTLKSVQVLDKLDTTIGFFMNTNGREYVLETNQATGFKPMSGDYTGFDSSWLTIHSLTGRYELSLSNSNFFTIK